MKGKNFVKRQAIDFGFETAKKNVFFFLSVFVVIIFANALLGILTGGLQNQGVISFLLTIIRIVVGVIISIGLIIISLKFVDGKKPILKDLLNTNWNLILTYFLVSLVKTVAVVIGLILLIIPGIIIGIRLQFASYLVVDKKMNVTDALKKSWDMTRGATTNLFLFGLLLFLINVVGFLALIVGLLITVPLSMVATAWVYRKIS